MNSKGYTLLELLIVLFLMGILAAIASASFVGFLQRQRVRAAADIVYRSLSEGRNQATSQKVDYSVDFRRDVDGFSYCVRQSVSECGNWQSFAGIYFARCTFPSEGKNFSVTTIDVGGVCTASFSWMGSVKGRLGGVYFKPSSQSRLCRGVWTKTLLSVLDNREIDRCQE